MKKIYFLCMSLMAIAIWSCSESSDEPQVIDNPRHEIVISRAESNVIGSTNQFALNLLEKLNATENGNFVVSPMSIAMDFGLVANGAGGNTLQEILNTIIGEDADIESTNSIFSTILTEFPTMDKLTELSFANGYIAANDWKFTPEFSSAASQYDMEVLQLNADPATMQSTIDAWVAEKTQNAIKELPFKNSFNRLSFVFLNALYFKGQWNAPFSKKETGNRTFHGVNGDAQVQMMHDTERKMQIGVQDGLMSVKLDYGNEAFYLQVIMPDEGVSLTEGAKTLKNGAYKHLQTNTAHTTNELYIPKFHIESNPDINGLLQDLGIKDAFDLDKADFRNILNYDVVIGEVVHKAMIDIDEEGTVAAAATGINMWAGANGGAPSKPVPTVIDRPFFFFVCEQSTGAILLMGRVETL